MRDAGDEFQCPGDLVLETLCQLREEWQVFHLLAGAALLVFFTRCRDIKHTPGGETLPTSKHSEDDVDDDDPNLY